MKFKDYSSYINEDMTSIEVETDDISTSSYGFDVVVSNAERAATVAAKANYVQTLESMAKENENILAWNFVNANKGITVDGWWDYKNETSNSWHSGFSSKPEYGIHIKFKYKLPIKSPIEGLKLNVGDVPEYTLIASYKFNTTGRKAELDLYDENMKHITYIGSVQGLTILERMKKLKPEHKKHIHEHLYEEFVKTVKDHPFRGKVNMRKFGV